MGKLTLRSTFLSTVLIVRATNVVAPGAGPAAATQHYIASAERFLVSTHLT